MRLYGSVEEVVTMCIKDMAFFPGFGLFCQNLLTGEFEINKIKFVRLVL